ncbi:ArsR/SmtB family transcription factor [Paenibacillus pasadenensis]|uniref:Transcription regulator n=1 Tax=Paenibacillus pasadenensis TaxID=217090 RepID=A0A2N5N4L3_9BACL|nr:MULTISPECIES: metalloregulator ArsR/SmtB family transcription factor [Paenibacillus]PLT45278.1 transcription regulator [Paenibacillus pasadenensis]QGG55684.1 metalloregulator ArsR/SmtB family transcription factor [Paenibacillus sp. B01]
MGKLAIQLFRQCLPVFQTLSDPHRQDILLHLHENGPLSVSDLTARLSLSRPAVSHHLKLLLQAGLLACEQQGTQRIYSLRLEEPAALLRELLETVERECLAPGAGGASVPPARSPNASDTPSDKEERS